MQWLAALFCVLCISCNSTTPAQADNDQPVGPATPADTDPVTPADELPGTTGTGKYTSYFDANQAWKQLEKQVELGFRVPGSNPHRACRRYLEQQLGKYSDRTEVQEFTVTLPSGPTKMWNIIGRFKPDSERRILLAAHWDTRPTADKNPSGERNQPIAGANDGASGVAVLLELARVFSEHEPPVGVDIVFFDGEDYGPGVSTMFLGSNFFSAHLGSADIAKYNYGILLDMVGDKDLDIHPEYNSEGSAGYVYAVAFELSETLGFDAFRAGGGYRIQDDHLSLLNKGLRMYDFIDFNYPHWHTTADTVDKCSVDSLKAVGRVVENLVFNYSGLYAPSAASQSKSSDGVRRPK